MHVTFLQFNDLLCFKCYLYLSTITSIVSFNLLLGFLYAEIESVTDKRALKLVRLQEKGLNILTTTNG